MPSMSGFHWTLAPFKPSLDNTSWMWRCYCPAVRFVYGDYVYPQFLYLSAWFYLSSCQLPFESIKALVGNSGCCAFNFHCLVWLLSAWFVLEFKLDAIWCSPSPWFHTYRSQCLLCVQLSLFGFALDLRVTFESWCDRYWMLCVSIPFMLLACWIIWTVIVP